MALLTIDLMNEGHMVSREVVHIYPFVKQATLPKTNSSHENQSLDLSNSF